MNLLKNVNRVERLHNLIQQEKTGTPKQLAETLGISRASLYLLIEELKSLNLQISYSRRSTSFYYESEVHFTLSCKVETITDFNELININGGNITFPLPSNFLDGRKIPLHSYFANTKSHATGFGLW